MNLPIGTEVEFITKNECIPEYKIKFRNVKHGSVVFKENRAVIIDYVTIENEEHYVCEYTDEKDKKVALAFKPNVVRPLNSDYLFQVGDEIYFIDNNGNPVKNSISGIYAVTDEFYSKDRGNYSGKGSVSLKKNKGIIKKIINNKQNYNFLVEYIDVFNVPVLLAFKSKNLKLITKSNTNVTNKTESSSTGIKVQRPNPSITGVERRRGVSISGRTSRTAVAVGHLSNKVVSF